MLRWREGSCLAVMLLLTFFEVVNHLKNVLGKLKDERFGRIWSWVFSPGAGFVERAESRAERLLGVMLTCWNC